MESEHRSSIAEERELKCNLPEARERVEATIPSLRKETTVIPGLDVLGNETPSGSDAQNREPDSNKQEKDTKEEGQGQGPTNQMIESLGKIVSQLQTLQGLTSSLQLLQNMPKGQEGAASKEVEKEKEVEAATLREKELSEETKRKVEALLANESDSEGEQVTRVIFYQKKFMRNFFVIYPRVFVFLSLSAGYPSWEQID